MTMTTTPCLSKKRRAFQKEALYDHDRHLLPFQEKETFFRRRLCMTLTTTSIFLPRRESCMAMTTTPSLSQQKWRAFEKKARDDHDHPFPSRRGELLKRRLCMAMTTTPWPFQEREYNFVEEGCVLLGRGRDGGPGCSGSNGRRCPSP